MTTIDLDQQTALDAFNDAFGYGFTLNGGYWMPEKAANYADLMGKKDLAAQLREAFKEDI